MGRSLIFRDPIDADCSRDRSKRPYAKVGQHRVLTYPVPADATQKPTAHRQHSDVTTMRRSERSHLHLSGR